MVKNMYLNKNKFNNINKLKMARGFYLKVNVTIFFKCPALCRTWRSGYRKSSCGEEA